MFCNLHFHQSSSLAQQLFALRELCDSNQQILIVVDDQFWQQKILEILDFQHDFFTFLYYISVILQAIEEDFSKESLLHLLKLFDDPIVFHVEQKIVRKIEFNGGLDNLKSMIDGLEAPNFKEIYEKILKIKNEIEKFSTATFEEFLVEHKKVIHINCGKSLKLDNLHCQQNEKLSLKQYRQKLKKIILFFQEKNITITNKINDFNYDSVIFFNVKNVQFCSKKTSYIQNVFDLKKENLNKFLLHNLVAKTTKSMFFFQDFSDLPLNFKELYYAENVKKNEEKVTCKTFEKEEKKFDFNLILQRKTSFYVDEFLFALTNPHTFWYSRILKLKKAKKITKKPQMSDLQRIFLKKIAGEKPKFFDQHAELMCIWEKKLANLQHYFDDWSAGKSLRKGEKFTRKTHVNDVEVEFKFQPTLAMQADFFDVRIVEEATQRQHAQIVAHLTRKDDLNFHTVRF